MTQQIFQSQYPILEACMNKGSTLELAIAVHRAGGYPSLCSWTYNGKSELMQQDINRFVDITGSNKIHLSFELNEHPNLTVHQLIKSHSIPTVEIIYGNANTFRITDSAKIEDDILRLLTPIKELGTRIFKRIYDPVDAATAQRHMIDGFCIKGLESAGFSSFTPVKELFLKQKELTPNAALIPYGGIGTSEQVKEYIDLGAEIVAVGTLLALSAESPIKLETKLSAINAQKENLIQFTHIFQDNSNTVTRKQTALQFTPYVGPDDANGTIGLVHGAYRKNSNQGHVYLGHGVDQVTEVLPCQQIIKKLVSLL
jgi:NAD(P)H-dependent flavin oxidoreductase YrpB (nitropropane dioxygenase family)